MEYFAFQTILIFAVVAALLLVFLFLHFEERGIAFKAEEFKALNKFDFFIHVVMYIQSEKKESKFFLTRDSPSIKSERSFVCTVSDESFVHMVLISNTL